MKKMNIPLMATLLVLSIIVCPILYFTLGPTLDPVQLETLKARNWKNCLHLIIKDSIPLAFGDGAAIPTISVNSAFGLPSTCSPSVRAWALSIGA